MDQSTSIWPKLQWLIQAGIVLVLISAIKDYAINRTSERQETQRRKAELEYQRRIAEELYLFESAEYREHWRKVRAADQSHEHQMCIISG